MAEQKKYTGRGGWHGGGRPETNRKCAISLRISPEAKAKLDRVYNKSEWIDTIIMRML